MAVSVGPTSGQTADGVQARRIYGKPPIVEVVLDVSLRPRESFKFEELSRFREQLLAGATPELQVEDSEGDDDESVPEAVQLVDEENGFRIFADGARFVFSRHQKYSRWEDFRDEAKRIWPLYANVAKPSAVTRASLRYVNRLDLPMEPQIDLTEYLNVTPRLAAGFTPSVSGFSLEVKMPQPDLPQTIVIVREASVKASQPKIGSVILDIEVARVMELANATGSEFWDVLELLHDRANQTFECAITDSVREIIK